MTYRPASVECPKCGTYYTRTATWDRKAGTYSGKSDCPECEHQWDFNFKWEIEDDSE